MNKVGVIGLGSYLPEKILTNADLVKMVDTTDEWIITRTGIKERHIAADDEATSDLATKAARRALDDAKLTPEDLDLIIVATITPDMQFPSTSCLVQRNLGAANAACFDISAACAGQIYGIVCAEQFIKSGTFKYALIIGAEKLSSIVDWKDRSTCVLFGDGAGACILGPVEKGGILSSYLGSNGNSAHLLEKPGGGSRTPATHETIDQRLHYLKMSGSEVFKIAVKIMAEAAEKAAKKVGLKAEDISCVIPHQANIRILKGVGKRMGISADKIFLNIERCGNMSSASTAVAFDEAAKSGRLKKGDIVVLDAFGSGLVWGAIVIEW